MWSNLNLLNPSRAIMSGPSKVEKKNPTVIFNKEVMDLAFSKAFAMLSPGCKSAYKRDFEKMLQRVSMFHV